MRVVSLLSHNFNCFSRVQEEFRVGKKDDINIYAYKSFTTCVFYFCFCFNEDNSLDVDVFLVPVKIHKYLESKEHRTVVFLETELRISE